MDLYFDKLSVPGFETDVEKELEVAFYNSSKRAKDFVSTFKRLLWEYNFVNQTFVHQYSLLTSGCYEDEKGDPFHDILVFGGTFAFSRAQITALVELIAKQPERVKGLQLNFTRIQTHGV